MGCSAIQIQEEEVRERFGKRAAEGVPERSRENGMVNGEGSVRLEFGNKWGRGRRECGLEIKKGRKGGEQH